MNIESELYSELCIRLADLGFTDVSNEHYCIEGFVHRKSIIIIIIIITKQIKMDNI